MKQVDPADRCWNCGTEDTYETLDAGMFECERCGHLHMSG
jgi:ribosomal protein L37AE/L43A